MSRSQIAVVVFTVIWTAIVVAYELHYIAQLYSRHRQDREMVKTLSRDFSKKF